MYTEFSFEYDTDNYDVLCELIQNFTIEMIPGFKLRNSVPQNYFDNFVGKYISYQLLSMGIWVNNLIYNDYWTNQPKFNDYVKENDIVFSRLDDIHVEYWFKSGKYEKNVSDIHFHLDGDDYAKLNSSEEFKDNKPLFTSLIYLNDSHIPTYIDDNENKKLHLIFPKKNHICLFDGGSNNHSSYKLFDFDDSNKRIMISIIVHLKQVKYTPELNIHQMYQWYYMKNNALPQELPFDLKYMNIPNKITNARNIYINSTYDYYNKYVNIIKSNVIDEKVIRIFNQKIVDQLNIIDNTYDLVSLNVTVNTDIHEDHLLDTYMINNTEYDYAKKFDPYDKSLFNVINDKKKMSPTICNWLIMESENYILKNNNGAWKNTRHTKYPTYDIALSVLPENVTRLILLYFKDNIGYQLLENYHINREIYKINIIDVFIVKYDMDTQQTLEQHTDDSDMSVIISLSDKSNYIGGGTKFENGFIVKQDQGDILMFPSKFRHEGLPITSGTRYLLVFFINIIE